MMGAIAATPAAPDVWLPEEVRRLDPIEQAALRLQVKNGKAVIKADGENGDKN